MVVCSEVGQAVGETDAAGGCGADQGTLGWEEILGVVFCLAAGQVVGEASVPRYRGQG